MTTTEQSRTVPMAPALRGLGTHLEALESGLAAARDGRGQVLLFEGRPGMGKTRLLREACDRAVLAGVRTLVGQASDGEQALPFTPLLTALSSSRPPAVDPDAFRMSGTCADVRSRQLAALRADWESAAAQSPTAVVLDDLQWADSVTLRTVRTLTADLRHSGVLWVLASRSKAAPAVRDAWEQLTLDGAQRWELAPLLPAMTAEIIAEVIRAPAHSSLLAMAELAFGNPSVLLELLRGLQEESRLTVEGGHAVAIGTRLPRRLTQSIIRRLSRLAPRTRRMVRMAAVLPQQFTAAQLADVLQCRPSELIDAFDEAVQAEFVIDHAGHLMFRHQLLRQAVRESLPASLQQALQSEAARGLTAQRTLQPGAMAEARSGARRLQNGQLSDLWMRLSGLLHLAAGRLDEARAEVQPVAAAPGVTLSGSAEDVIRMITYGGLAQHTGEDRFAAEATKHARTMRQAPDRTARLWATRVLATSVDPDQAVRLLEDDPIVSMASLFPADHDFLVFAAGLAITTADPDLASRVRVAATALVQDGGAQPLLHGLAAFVHGALDRDIERLEHAVELLRPVSRPLLYAAALEQAGVVLAGQGQLSAAATRWRTALDIFAECRATVDVERLTRRLHESGERQQRGKPRPAFGWASLTESELRVAREVAGGATNRQIARRLLLSPHTVNTHVRHVFAKLDINSRVQLANLVHRVAG